ncbi:unnamed protein product [Ilex paraguariensis]|uniref:Uncharacterized protein n=1 Tax=Ilex paraguariensis TaxID=185542 RepID=A0ABC8SZ17_9AQUA
MVVRCGTPFSQTCSRWGVGAWSYLNMLNKWLQLIQKTLLEYSRLRNALLFLGVYFFYYFLFLGVYFLVVNECNWFLPCDARSIYIKGKMKVICAVINLLHVDSLLCVIYVFLNIGTSVVIVQ